MPLHGEEHITAAGLAVVQVTATGYAGQLKRYDSLPIHPPAILVYIKVVVAAPNCDAVVALPETQ